MRDTKQQLIRKGTKLFLHHSFQGTGISDVLKEAGVPKGSFYHFFPSKEAFALQVIKEWTRNYAARAEEVLSDPGLSYPQRVQAFFTDLLANIKKSGYRYGCLLGTLGQEMAASSEPLRQAVDSGFADSYQSLANCIAQGQAKGEINQALDPHSAARFIFAAMQGSLIMAKVEKTDQSLDGFVTTVMQLLATPQNP